MYCFIILCAPTKHVKSFLSPCFYYFTDDDKKKPISILDLYTLNARFLCVIKTAVYFVKLAQVAGPKFYSEPEKLSVD